MSFEPGERYYCGSCPQGGEPVHIRDGVSWKPSVQNEQPWIECPLHGCKVLLSEESKLMHDEWFSMLRKEIPAAG